MTYCAVKGCHNASHKHEKDSKVTFHSFPTDPVMALQWVKKLRLNRKEERWKPTKHTKICSEHFRDSERFLTKGGNWKLKKKAVPTKGLHINCIESGESNHGSHEGALSCQETDREHDSNEESEHNEDDSSDSQETRIKLEDPCSSPGPDPISEETDPTSVKHRRPNDSSRIPKLKRLITIRKSLQQKYNKEIKMLNQRTRRLQKRYESLKQDLKDLQKEMVY